MGLKEKRKERKIKQADMAAMFNIGYRTYQNYESGKTYPTMEQAAQLARYFNCTIGELFDLQAYWTIIVYNICPARYACSA